MAAGKELTPSEYIQHHLTFFSKPIGDGGFCARSPDGRWYSRAHVGVDADLVTYGKGIGAGVPVAVVDPTIGQLVDVAITGADTRVSEDGTLVDEYTLTLLGAPSSGPIFLTVSASFASTLDRSRPGLADSIELSSDGGVTWSAESKVNLANTSATQPATTFDATGTAWVVWEHHELLPTDPAHIFSARWNGSAWTGHTRVDAASARTRAIEPTIASATAGTFVAWTDYRYGSSNANIYAARWNGSAWVESIVVSRTSSGT